MGKKYGLADKQLDMMMDQRYLDVVRLKTVDMEKLKEGKTIHEASSHPCEMGDVSTLSMDATVGEMFDAFAAANRMDWVLDIRQRADAFIKNDVRLKVAQLVIDHGDPHLLMSFYESNPTISVAEDNLLRPIVEATSCGDPALRRTARQRKENRDKTTEERIAIREEMRKAYKKPETTKKSKKSNK